MIPKSETGFARDRPRPIRAIPQRGRAATQRGTAILAVRTGGTPLPLLLEE